jgi:hypothetical protein
MERVTSRDLRVLLDCARSAYVFRGLDGVVTETVSALRKVIPWKTVHTRISICAGGLERTSRTRRSGRRRLRRSSGSNALDRGELSRVA